MILLFTACALALSNAFCTLHGLELNSPWRSCLALDNVFRPFIRISLPISTLHLFWGPLNFILYVKNANCHLGLHVLPLTRVSVAVRLWPGFCCLVIFWAKQLRCEQLVVIHHFLHAKVKAPLSQGGKGSATGTWQRSGSHLEKQGKPVQQERRCPREGKCAV